MKSVLITGANRGLGLALARQFSDCGYELNLVVRSALAQAELTKEFHGAQILVCDITSEEYESQLTSWLDSKPIDVVVNNAGSGTKAPTLQSTKPDFLRKEFENNCVGVLTTVKGALCSLKNATEALVVNVSSRRGSLTMQSELAAKGSGCSYSYRISKAAQNMLTLCLADDLEEFGIRVIAIHPGRLLTAMAASDAQMTPENAARKLVTLIQSNELKNRDYISLETGHLPW